MMLSLRYLLLRCQAWVWLVGSQTGAAKACFEKMLALRPCDRHALESYAHVLALCGDRPAAIHALKHLTKVHPRHAAGWFNLGFLLEASGQLADAGAAFRCATEIAPALDRAWYGLALVYIREQRLDEAVTALLKNTQLQPMSPHGWYQLARVYVQQQAPDEALGIMRHLQQFEPKIAAQLERETGLLLSSAGGWR